MTLATKSVSVVIATYNGARFIEEQIDSVLRQTVEPMEMIVSDDISSDETLDIVRRISAGSRIPIRIRVNERRLGFRDNFLSAAASAEGRFIAFCDQDDVWDPRKLEKVSEYLDDPRVSMIVHAATSFDHLTGKTSRFSQGIWRTGIKPPLSYDPWLTFFGFSIVFRRDLLGLASRHERFEDFIVPGERIAHDRWIMFLGQMVGATVELDESLVRYRQHAGSLFGDGRSRARSRPREAIQTFDTYIAATSDMIDIVERLPDDTAEQFPLFDREKSIAFLRRALQQLTQRREVYEKANRYVALCKIAENVRLGVYQSVHCNSLRWRSLAKDVKSALFVIHA